jgi:hypothetical protein
VSHPRKCGNLFERLYPLFSGGDANSAEDFNPLWISEFKKTNAYEVWDRTTDPMLFDVVEPRSVNTHQGLHFKECYRCAITLGILATRKSL